MAGTGERTVLLAAERSSNEEHTWVEQIPAGLAGLLANGGRICYVACGPAKPAALLAAEHQ
jgi:hypothetical protein